MTSREPVDIAAIRAAVANPNGPYARVDYTAFTGSTNADLVAAGHQNAPAWTAAVTEYQNSGRGRHGRVWTAPKGSHVTLSILIRPTAESIERLGTMPLVSGLAIIDALTATAARHPDATDKLTPQLKWPNDVLIDGRKLCGILAEAVSLGPEPAVVIGLGLNVSITTEELPVPHATSLDLEAPGIEIDRAQLTADVLLALHHRINQWVDADPQLMADYRAVCSSIGADVKVLLPGDEELLGTVRDVADDGRLVVVDKQGSEHVLAAGDVTHLRLQ